ncbi:membrane protein [Burkholderia phage BcepF1]|uniref:Membrane protein n=1 Tax=Burkholderia phage BcepF1 TaxID=2886897 RepID=A1YZZ3_9CAUD|nr:membrane protein [Burkholderia phage BcepF1]ABL96820.1 membrane protein [Burkholderia phage BcepF1]
MTALTLNQCRFSLWGNYSLQCFPKMVAPLTYHGFNLGGFMEIISDLLMIFCWVVVGHFLRPSTGEIDDIRRGLQEIFGKRG